MGKRYNPFKRFGQSGQSILIVALALPIFMFLLAIVFDVGMYFVQASKLQNAADSAALAGVAVYTNNCTTKLISKPSDMDFEESFDTSVSGTEYTFDPIDDKNDADSQANTYIQKNRSDLTLKDNGDTGLWYSPITVTLVDKSTASYTGLYCYRVDLKEPVPLNFAKYFGFDSFDVTASAIALAIPTANTVPEEDDIDEFIKVVNASIYKTAPNLYWESIYNSSSSNKYSVTSTDADTGAVTTEDGEVYGAKNDRYFTTTINDYTSDSELTQAAGIDDDTLAWKASEDEFCADPIHGTDTLGLKTLVYTINKTFVSDKTSTKKEATSIYIDRPNTQSGGLGTPYRSCAINITGDKLSSDEDTPLYMRGESEPILVNGQAMLVQPLIVNIQAYQKKPMIIAYDGPDPNRKKADTPCVDTNTGMTYKWNGSKWERTYWKEAGGIDYTKFTSSFSDGASNLAYTSETTSAPVTINLDHDFRGVVYAPYSKVIVYGPGAIDGFIMAAEIEDHGTSSTRKTHKTVSSIPNWGASYDNGATNWFKYEVFRVSAEYNVIYDSFTNYTWTDLGSGV